MLQTVSYMDGSRPTKFDVSPDYDLEYIIGEGAYGVVICALHIPSMTRVAIKKILLCDRAIICLRTLREIKLIRHFQNENIVQILEILRPPSLSKMNEVYLVEELMDTDLGRILLTQKLTDDHVQFFLYQLLRGLKALHSADVLHRDLKPGNLLVNSDCDLKICDFGLARSAKPSQEAEKKAEFMTEYVATRWYRAPEIILTFQSYTKAIDMWSVGCILAEMLTGKPLFPGKDYVQQLTLVIQTLGTPPPEAFKRIRNRRTRHFISTMPYFEAKSFRHLFYGANPLAIDLLRRILCWIPEQRLTVEQALAHPYLAYYHDEQDEPEAPPLPESFFSYESIGEISGQDLRRMVFEEITKNCRNHHMLQSLPTVIPPGPHA